jgi:hypothetical protein
MTILGEMVLRASETVKETTVVKRVFILFLLLAIYESLEEPV